jgi:hypothetical protein
VAKSSLLTLMVRPVMIYCSMGVLFLNIVM